MARKKNGQAPQAGYQPSLFDVIREQQDKKMCGREDVLEAGSLNIAQRIREELSKGLRLCGRSRYEVAARMSELAGVEITKSQLDSWTAESKECHRFPAEYMPAFVAATGHKQLLKMMAELVQCYILESEDALMAELGKIDTLKRDLSRKEKMVRELLETMTGQKAKAAT